MIPIENYTSKKIFDIEKEKYFAKGFCLGTVSGLSKKNDFKTVNDYFEPLTIRNIDGIKVFSNVCLHRSCLIDIEAEGNHPFSCRYHGWSYNSDGTIKNTPFDDALKNCNRRLKNLESAIFDRFIVINPDAESFKFYSDIENNFPMAGSEFFYKSQMLHNCNWKILVENVLEPYHISFVHKDSFVNIGLPTSSDYEWHPNDCGTYNVVTSKSDKSKFYRHQDVYPNLFVSDTSGLVTFVSYFFPIDVDKTLLFYELWESESLAKKPSYVRKEFKQRSIEFAEKVLLEDRQIVEAAQIGVSKSRHDYILSNKFEQRVIEFHKKYLAIMVEK